MKRQVHLVLLAAACVAGSCMKVPPSTVTRDRFDYGNALGESWKRQTLMNVVRLRYADAPMFLDIASVINSYTLSGTASAGGTLRENPDIDELSAGVSGTWSNTPTVTYQPVMGQKFAKNLLTPLPPSSIFQMMQSGWPVEVIFPIAVRSANGLRGQSMGGAGDSRFAELLGALSRIQRSGAIGFRIEPREGGEAVIMVLRQDLMGQVPADASRARELLGLKPGLAEFSVTFGLVPRSDTEIALVTRSMLEIMLEVGFGIDVPETDVREGRVLTGQGTLPAGAAPPLVAIHSGKVAPPDAYAAVPYRGNWYWIDDTDVPSKRTFTFLMILFSLAETGQPQAGPLVTIGTGR